MTFLNAQFQGVKQVLVKLGDKGSAFFTQGEKPIRQSIISAAEVLDTTGAGDTFTASFAVALVEGKSKEECLKFAGTSSYHIVYLITSSPLGGEKESVSYITKFLIQ